MKRLKRRLLIRLLEELYTQHPKDEQVFDLLMRLYGWCAPAYRL